jgi:hypothetical protein
MSFVARCESCGQQVRVPDSAFGATRPCPRCADVLTLLPVDNVEIAVAARSPGLRATAARTAVGDSLTVAELVRLGQRAPVKPRWIHPGGVGALLATGAALLCGLVPALCGLVVPLGVVGLLLGLVSLFVPGRRRFRQLYPVAGTMAAGAVLVIALVSPDLLGPVYLASQLRETVDPTRIRVVPLPGQASAGLTDPEWVDAGQAALQQGGLYVQVLSATIRSVPVKSTPGKKSVPVQRLFVCLRTQQSETAVFAANPSATPGPRPDKASPKLTDSTGKVYALLDVQEAAAAVDKKRKANVFPVAVHDEVFVFEAPAPGLDYLHLEVPAAAWGGSGAFRFTIPGTMIRNEMAGPQISGAGP